jgi:hypothetical protein
MGKNLVDAVRRMVAFHNESRESGNALAQELLELPPEEWEAWSGERPEARSYGALSTLCKCAAERLRTHAPFALSITELLTRHVDAVVVPPDMDVTRAFLRINTWQTHARALRCCRRLDEALQAYETAAAIARAEPAMYEDVQEIEREIRGFLDIPDPIVRTPTQDDIRRAEELIEKYGLHHLREEKH